MPLPPQRPRDHAVRPIVPWQTAPDAALPGKPVNPYSRAVHPREQYPQHFDFLMRDIFARGLAPEEWQVIAADEVRLDESGMEVEFTLLRTAANQVWRRRVQLQHGKLVAIRDC